MIAGMRTVNVRDVGLRAFRHLELNGRRDDEVGVADDIPRRDCLPAFGCRRFFVECAGRERALGDRHERIEPKERQKQRLRRSISG
jgi:hypothetical protein